MNMFAETNFIAKGPDKFHLLKTEAIDRLNSVVYDLPKYKKNLDNLITNFAVDEAMYLINTIHRDKEFKTSKYYRRYSKYFDEIEDMIHKYI